METIVKRVPDGIHTITPHGHRRGKSNKRRQICCPEPEFGTLSPQRPTLDTDQLAADVESLRAVGVPEE